MLIRTSSKIRFSVREYLKMSDAGVFDDRRVELLAGRIIQSPRQSHNEMVVHSKISPILFDAFGDISRYWVTLRGAFVIEPIDAPEPDFAIYDAAVGTPDMELPLPFVVIEVAEKTYARDSSMKLRRYAAAGVSDYWIVNILAQRVEVYRKPENPTGLKKDWRYGAVQHFGVGRVVPLLAYPMIQFTVRGMLP